LGEELIPPKLETALWVQTQQRFDSLGENPSGGEFYNMDMLRKAK